MTNQREITQIIPSRATSDGDGVNIRRIAGFNNAAFSPFLMVDELKSDDSKDYVGGFPPHPHRGIETLTYMLKGHFQHKDHMGNVGELRSGGAQWMAAGRGVIHSEMPMMEEGDLHGFQIWINQPAKDKMKPAKYHDFQSDSITEWEHDGNGLLRVIAGELAVEVSGLNGDQNENGTGTIVKGPLNQTGVPVTFADWRAQAGDLLDLKPDSQQSMMIYVYKGDLVIGERKVRRGEMALLSTGDAVSLISQPDENLKGQAPLEREESGVLIFVGQPIHEPVVHYGPFVMNSMEEIEQTIQDYNSGVFETY